MTTPDATEPLRAPAHAPETTRTGVADPRQEHDAAPGFLGRRAAQDRRPQGLEAPGTDLTSACVRDPAPPCSDGGPAREKRLADVPTKYRGLYRRAWAKASRKSAIRAFCLECAGWSESEVLRCTSTACPLFEFRKHG